MARPWGFVVNEIGDRTSDLLAFAGLAVLAARQDPDGETALVAVGAAALAATLPTWAALAAAGAGAPRANGGPVGKTERCLLLVVSAAVPAWIVPVCAAIVAGSVLTAVVRLARAHADLAAMARR